ncbi:hypothetical protein BH20ACT9_BH20ACT9_07190 [soil metagenome]
MSHIREQRRRGMRLVLAAVLALLATVALATAAAAQSSAGGGKFLSGQRVVVPAGRRVTHDLYVSAGQIAVDGVVQGDLLAAGGQVDVPGTVTGDVMVAGGTVTVSGEVGGDVRAAGGQVSVAGRVGEDLLVGAGEATVASPARVGEDFVFGTGGTNLGGVVAGDVLGSTDRYQATGSVGGTERVRVGRPEAEEEPAGVADWVLAGLGRYVSILVVGALALWALPRLLRASGEAARRRPLLSLGVGLAGAVGYVLALLALVVVTVLLAVLFGLVGLGELAGTTVFAGLLTGGAVSFAFAVAVLFLAPAVIGLLLGWLVTTRHDRPSYGPDLVALALGTLAVVALTALPYVGAVAGWLVVLFGLGAILISLRRTPPPAPDSHA